MPDPMFLPSVLSPAPRPPFAKALAGSTHWRRVGRTSIVVLATLLLGACASNQRVPAPLGERPVAVPAGTAAAPPAGAVLVAPGAGELAPPAALPRGAENAGKPGYYTIKPGDTLIRIGLDAGQNWRDLARWNNLDNPNQLEVGQVLRVVPPEPVAVAQAVAPAGRVEGRPIAGTGGTAPGAVPGAAGGASAPGAVPLPPAGAASAAPAAPAAVPLAAREPDDDVAWAWPAGGPLLAGFDDVRTKGLAIGGIAGDPVFAAADGRVVYAGSGLRGYGNLVIVKHNNTYLSAYAHNQRLLVREDQVVRRGQPIAEMGNSDADRVQLHFEIRRQGRPVDPARLLPAR